jgi:5-(carboxyamino)imidazole ribonucleotide mutase
MTPTIGIILGSDSDLPIMQQAATALDELGIRSEMHIMSAHRTPDDTANFARGAASRGLRAIIAGAGGAAHLPGVLAAYTCLPVIGVPISLSTTGLGGMDALLAIVQMPRGIPVATVAINGAYNAGLLAAQILATADEALRGRLAAHRLKMAESVRAKDAALLEKSEESRVQRES